MEEMKDMEKYCTSCGEPIISGNRFCLNCGSQFENDNEKELNEEIKKEDEMVKPEKKTKIIKKKKKSILKSILIAIGIIVVLFIALAIFLITSLDASFTAAEFKGEYSGTFYFEEIEYGMGENPEDLLKVVSSFELPIKARVIEHETYDGIFILLNPETLEEESLFIFSAEYDQIIGNYEDENGDKEYIQAIVNQDTDRITISGHHEYISFDEKVRVVNSFEITEQSELKVENFTELYKRFNTAISEYFDSLIEDNTDAEEEFSYTGTEEVYGYYPLNIIGNDETGYIIFSKGQAPGIGSLPPVSFDLEGWAYVALGTEPIIVQYTDEMNIFSLNRYIETDTGEYYIDGDRNIAKIVYDEMKVDDDGIYRPSYTIDVQSELPVNEYVADSFIVLTSKLEDGKLLGDITVNNFHTEETFTINFEGK